MLVMVLALLMMLTGFVVSYAFVGQTWEIGLLGLAVAFAVTLIMTLVSYYQGDMIMMAMAGAREADEEEYRQLLKLVKANVRSLFGRQSAEEAYHELLELLPKEKVDISHYPDMK